MDPSIFASKLDFDVRSCDPTSLTLHCVNQFGSNRWAIVEDLLRKQVYSRTESVASLVHCQTKRVAIGIGLATPLHTAAYIDDY